MFYRSSNRPHSVRIRNLTMISFGLIASIFLIDIAHQADASANREIRSQARDNSAHVRNRQPVRTSAMEALGKLPLTFEANRGQMDARVKFISRGAGYNLFLTSTETVLALVPPRSKQHVASTSAVSSTVLRMKLVGASAAAQVVGLDQITGRVNYFTGSDPHAWRTNVPLFKRVKYASVYPGVDVVYYGNQQQLEYDVHVAPGADPRRVRFSFEGARRVRIDKQGNLVLKVTGGEVRHLKPVIYQEVNGERRQVAGRYVLLGQKDVGFEVGTYDTSLALVIDPILLYSSYLGGGGLDVGQAVAVDASGCVYVTGLTSSVNFPVRNAYRQAPPPDPFVPFLISTVVDVFVTKIDPMQAGDSSLIYSTYLGGGGSEEGRAIAVDTSGNAYITGYTDSFNNGSTPQDEGFPVTADAFQKHLRFPRFGVPTDVFVTKLNATGNDLVYSTYLGGSAHDIGEDIAVDASGHAYVTGSSDSFDSDPLQADDVFPTTAGAFQSSKGSNDGSQTDAFVTKFDSTGSTLIYSTYLGGAGGDTGFGVAVDTTGNAHIAGSTTSLNFPTVNAFQPAHSGGRFSAFVSKLNSDGTMLTYSSYFGGVTCSGCDSGEATDIALDSSGKSYVTGNASQSLPVTPGAFQSAPTGFSSYAPFVAKFDTAQNGPTSLVYATYLGPGTDTAHAIAVDAAGNAYVTGQTNGLFPTTSDGVSTTFGGGGDAFVAKLNPTASDLLYGTYLGGTGRDTGRGIAVDADANIYVTGETESTNFPIATAFQSVYGGWVRDAFLTKIGPRLFTISGLVTKSAGGDMLAGVSIALTGGRTATATTNTSGFYSFTVPAEAGYTITPSLSGYTFDPTSRTFDNLASEQVADFIAIAEDAPTPTPTPTPSPTPTYQIRVLYDEEKAHRSGSTIPIKLQLTDAAGVNRSSPDVLVTAIRIERLSDFAPGQLEEGGHEEPENNFRFDPLLGGTGGYKYNFKTTGLQTGTYALLFRVSGDSITYRVRFQVK